ncbi:MAG: LA_2478/LA_2722/LA_4182 family protein [Leptospira bouyouniensis]
MKFLSKTIITLLTLLSFMACNKLSQSPEAKLKELVPKFQKTMCSKTIECTKDEFAKIPPAYRNMIPPFMQSEENCISFFEQKMKEAEKKRIEEKKEVTAEQVESFEKCINAFGKLTCDSFKGAKEKVNIPECEEAQKLSGNN